MKSVTRGGVFSHLDLLALIVVLGLFLLCLPPSVLRCNSRSRVSNCLNNLKQIGLGFQNMDSARRRFPPSCAVTKDPKGAIVSMDPGWSWGVYILPYIEQRPLWDAINLREEKPLDGNTGPASALAISIKEYRCPAFTGNPYIDMKTKKEAITNYKAIGATHLESLNVASPKPTTPRYEPPYQHPDGGCFPGSRHGTDGFSRDGTAHTVLVVETVEPNVARWTVGTEACVVGLPPVVTFENAGKEGLAYAHPTGYTVGKFWDKSTIPPKISKTYLKWDYNDSPYSDGGIATPSTAAGGPIKYGPSSHHPGITNHGLADGSVHSMSNDIDAAAYMFAITRMGRDPNARLH